MVILKVLAYRSLVAGGVLGAGCAASAASWKAAGWLCALASFVSWR